MALAPGSGKSDQSLDQPRLGAKGSLLPAKSQRYYPLVHDRLQGFRSLGFYACCPPLDRIDTHARTSFRRIIPVVIAS